MERFVVESKAETSRTWKRGERPTGGTDCWCVKISCKGSGPFDISNWAIWLEEMSPLTVIECTNLSMPPPFCGFSSVCLTPSHIPWAGEKKAVSKMISNTFVFHPDAISMNKLRHQTMYHWFCLYLNKMFVVCQGNCSSSELDAVEIEMQGNWAQFSSFWKASHAWSNNNNKPP